MFETKETDNTLFIYIEGSMDIHKTREFKEQLTTIIKKDFEKKIVVDLSQVKYIDSSMLGVLIYGNELLKPYRKKIILKEPNDAVMRVLNLTQLKHVFTYE